MISSDTESKKFRFEGCKFYNRRSNHRTGDDVRTEYIQDGDVLILDAGSTVTELAKQLVHKHQLTIVTSALNIALLLGSQPSFEILVTGGEFKAPSLSLTGERAADFFGHLHVDKLFLTAGGISPEMELTYPGLKDLPVKQAMIESATDVYLVADSLSS